MTPTWLVWYSSFQLPGLVAYACAALNCQLCIDQAQLLEQTMYPPPPLPVVVVLLLLLLLLCPSILCPRAPSPALSAALPVSPWGRPVPAPPMGHGPQQHLQAETSRRWHNLASQLTESWHGGFMTACAMAHVTLSMYKPTSVSLSLQVQLLPDCCLQCRPPLARSQVTACHNTHWLP